MTTYIILYRLKANLVKLLIDFENACLSYYVKQESENYDPQFRETRLCLGF